MYKTCPDIGQRVVFIISQNGVIARMFAGCVHFIAPHVYLPLNWKFIRDELHCIVSIFDLFMLPI